eukprot:GEZU01020862.1.p1 GENE.GEZU01020862.1~~GEZU01020862.1.p1  ORF type:complete len:343 (-),score=24.00 GEZU01020862.1:914-1906(-)
MLASYKKQYSSSMLPKNVSNRLGIGAGLAMGVIFGFTFEKAKVFLPTIIQQQMLMSNFTMLKVFLTATIVGCAVITALCSFGIRQRIPKNTVIFANIVGGLWIGIGMSVTGACPGTVFAQLGVGLYTAKYVFIGGLVGVLLFSLIEKEMRPITEQEGNLGPLTLDRVLKVRHEVAAGGFIAVLAFVLVVVELLRPWSSDLVDAQMISSVDDASWFPLNLLATAWSPYTAGIVIGLLQFHALFFIDTLLGTSSSYVTTLGYIFRAFSQNNTPEYVRKFMDTGKHLWQVALVVGIVIGAFFSSMLSGTTYPDPGVGRIAAFFGGVALVFGAR